jgi:hypothetical protein
MATTKPGRASTAMAGDCMTRDCIAWGPQARNPKPDRINTAGMGSHADAMALTPQPLNHHLLRFTPIQIHHQPSSQGNLLEGQAGANEVERTRGAPQIQIRLGISHP